MFEFIDKHIERLIKKHMHNRRNIYIDEAIAKYIATHHPDQQTVDELRAKLNLEIETAFAYGDGSTIRAGIIRARWIFWLTAVFSTVLTLLFVSFPVATPGLIFVLPVVLTLLNYVITVGTIPLSYESLMRGAMDASIVAFEQHSQHQTRDVTPIPALREMESDKIVENKNPINSISLVNKAYSLWKKKPDSRVSNARPEVDLATVPRFT